MVLALRNLWPKERTEKKDSKGVILVNSMIKDSCFCSSRSLINRDRHGFCRTSILKYTGREQSVLVLLYREEMTLTNETICL